MSKHAVGAVESILVLQAEHRPGAKGIAWEREDNCIDFTSKLEAQFSHYIPIPPTIIFILGLHRICLNLQVSYFYSTMQ